MASKKRINPNRIPVTQADINRAKREAVDKVMPLFWSVIFTVLRDKEGYDLDGLRRVWSEVEDLSDSLAQGYVSVSDLKHILQIEGDVYFKF